MNEIILILACVPLYVVSVFCDKFISATKNNRAGSTYNVLKFFVCALFTIPVLVAAKAPRLSWGALICGIGCGILYTISKTLILKGYEKTSVSFMTLCHSSGMIIPCVVAHFLWDERLSFVALIGIVLTIAAVVLLKDSGGEKGKINLIGILIGLVIFLTSGGVMIFQKVMGIHFENGVAAYNLFSFLVPVLALLPTAGVKKAEVVSLKKIVLCAIGGGVAFSVISLVMTAVSGAVPSVIMFPLFNGIGIIAVCIGSIFAFKEKLNRNKIIGLIIGVLGLCLVNI